MSNLPDYINCANIEIIVCRWYMHEACKETCAYAKDVKGLGIGACCDSGLLKKIKKEVKNNGR